MPVPLMPQLRLADKVALVTGAARGIGLAIARRFADEGARVVLVDRLEEVTEAAESIGGSGAMAIRADVTQDSEIKEAVAAAVARNGRLDVLVCNAGRPWSSTSLTATDDDWTRCLDLNLRAAWIASRASHPHLRASGAGAIVTIASTHGYRSNRTSFPYSAAKGGLLALTRTLAVEYAPDNIRVNAVVPGQIESVRTAAFFDGMRDPDEARRRVLSTFPLRRLGTPDDIAHAALFLASDEAAWITGTWLTVDGGRDAALVDLSDLQGQGE
jgi:NAD(P)-dependent dehydrogenase (short-subunit alcohol dehydrogenase family)